MEFLVLKVLLFVFALSWMGYTWESWFMSLGMHWWAYGDRSVGEAESRSG